MKIAVLLSGGVDSSTALWRLKEAGYTDITAFYLKIWLEDDAASMGSCPWEEDMSYAQAVCDAAGVKLEVVPLQLEYYDRVVSYALEELRSGRTPSPDIFCNERIKFGAFFNHLSENFDKIASGHYARIEYVSPEGKVVAEDKPGRYKLLRAPDPVKDQTYFLSHLSQEQLGKILFPIGDLHKTEVRELAHRYDLATQSRPDSQGICFLGKIRYPEFVKFYLGEKQGPIVELETGKALGTHQGFWFHTVGQRSGLGLGNGPWYVSAKDAAENIVYVSHRTHMEERIRNSFEIEDFSWISGFAPGTEELDRWNARGLTIKLRHGPALTACTVSAVSSEAAGGPATNPDVPAADAASAVFRVTLEKGDKGIAAGQFGVLYLGDECLGSGKIREIDASELGVLRDRYSGARAEETRTAAEAAARKRAKKHERYIKYVAGKEPASRGQR